MKAKMKFIAILRLVSQVIFFIVLPAMYVNAFSGIQQLYTALISNSFSFSDLWPQIVETTAIIPATIILGRFFCGWMCAFGTLGDMIYLASSRILKTKFRISPNADRILKNVKYLVLAFLVVAVWTLGIATFSSASPWNVFGTIATIGAAPDLSFAITQLTPGFLLFLFIMIGSFFVERFFCRYLCPLGAIFAIVSKLRLVKIRKPGQECGDCMACTKNCAMGIEMRKADMVSSGECINCFQCVSACPRKNVSVAVSDQDLRPVVAGVVAVTIIAGTYYAGSLKSDSSYLSYGADSTVTTEQSIGVETQTSDIIADTRLTADSSAASASSAQVEAQGSTYADGTYQGTGTGFRGGQTTVSVTIQNDVITDIQVVSYEDDAPFFSRAASSVISDILSSQATQVNAVSGATYSSNGIMSAVADALSNAPQA
jgi:uncharacterized protein with FMN-binding domain/Fe-S-cluster-containing hydrogenase component 2